MFTKHYVAKSLHCTVQQLQERAEAIATLHEKYGLAFSSQWLNATQDLEYGPHEQSIWQQQCTKLQPAPKRRLTPREFHFLANVLDTAYALGLVHGDIHSKNILYHKGAPWIIDWEPCLTRWEQERPKLRYTYPWIDPQDAQQSTLTWHTDALCFAKLILNNSVSKTQQLVASESWRALLLHIAKPPQGQPAATPFHQILEHLHFAS